MHNIITFNFNIYFFLQQTKYKDCEILFLFIFYSIPKMYLTERTHTQAKIIKQDFDTKTTDMNIQNTIIIQIMP